MRRKGRTILVAVLVATAIAIASLALAHWTSIGSGSADAQATAAVNSVISPGINVPDLYPGAVSSVTVTITNPNPYPVVVNSISAGSSAVVNGTCVAGSVTTDARPTDATGLFQSEGAKIIAAAGSATYTLTTRMTTAAANACQAQTFSLPLTATLTGTT
jgi:hypothetical protein